MAVHIRLFIRFLLLLGSVACTIVPPSTSSTATISFTIPQTLATRAEAQANKTVVTDCPVTEAIWIEPPHDAAVQNAPTFGHYFVNEDYSIWALAFGATTAEEQMHDRTEGIKVGWFRPTGATLAISGRRIDAPAAPLQAQIPCCYPTRFQATGLLFPTEGCWEVTAKAADSTLTFIVWIQ